VSATARTAAEGGHRPARDSRFGADGGRDISHQQVPHDNDPNHNSVRSLSPPDGFDLAQTCGPVTWGGGRWPHHSWSDGELIGVGWEVAAARSGGRWRLVWRGVRQGDGALAVRGTGTPTADHDWLTDVLGLDQECPAFADPAIEQLRGRFRGLRPLSDGSLFDGLVTSIVGQSISVAAAAVTTARLAALFHPGVEIDGRRFWPLPRPDQLAEADPALIRTSGVTWRRAEALVAAGRAGVDGLLPDRHAALAAPDAARLLLRSLPLVGPWTAESALLWGVGLADAHPTGDVALLRAARRHYDRPALTLRDLDRLAEAWRPARAWAARLLWTDLLGEAP
jgi:3-methyladenine DNA glycosylase/8-oxoguanine DNA glycosylase